MSKEPLALSTSSPSSLEEESGYAAICATVMESARGRWFLEEYARRNRTADTRLVLAAIERIEGLIRRDRSQQAYRDIRADLLEMARTIAQTRAEIVGESEAAIQHEPAAPGTKRLQTRSEIFATAERLHDAGWTMRERGIDPGTCEEIETLASSILAASSLRDPADHRAQKLKAVLQYLERRIASMLDAGAQADAMWPAGAAENEAQEMTAARASDRTSESNIGAGEIDRAPLLATAVELPANATDWSGELALDPLVIAPRAAAMPTHAAMPVAASQAFSLSEAAPGEEPSTKLIPAVELAIVELAMCLDTIPTITGGTVQVEPQPETPREGATEQPAEAGAETGPLDIEQELFAPAPIDSPRDKIVTRRFRAAPSADPTPRPDSPTRPTVAAAPVEQIALAPMTIRPLRR
jgi:hypothetical protein